MMRVSTTFIHNQGLQSILDQQNQLVKTQQKLSLGVKHLTPSDNPSAASRILDLNEAIAQITQHEENTNFATQRLSLEETSLKSAENVLFRARELAITAGNTAIHNQESRQAIVTELKQRLEELMGYANTQDASGEYLFSGYQTGVKPFTDDGLGNYSYNGDQGQMSIQISNSRQVVVTDSGADIFQLIRNGNGVYSVDSTATNTGTGVIDLGSLDDPTVYQAHDFTINFTGSSTYDVIDNTTGLPVLVAQAYQDGGDIQFNGITLDISGSVNAGDSFTVNASRNQDMFTTLQNLITDIETLPDTASGEAHLRQGINNALYDIDQSINSIINTRTIVGGRLNSIESQADDNAARKLHLETVRSDVRDLDLAEAISNMTFESTALQIAQQTFAKVQNLSLFNFL